MTGATTTSRIQHLRLATIDDWVILVDVKGRSQRKAIFVLPVSESEDESENVDGGDQEIREQD